MTAGKTNGMSTFRCPNFDCCPSLAGQSVATSVAGRRVPT